MLRYVGFLWDERNPAARESATRMLAKCRTLSCTWRTVYDTPGCVVLAAGEGWSDAARVVHGDRGVVLGHLFRASQPESPRVELTEAESARIASSAGRSLIREFWGNYVAFLSDPTTGTRSVLRAPCATLPCLHTRVSGVDVYFSWMETCAQLFPSLFSIDWQHLARSLIGPLLSDRTGLNEVREILPGFCDELRGKECRHHCYWNPIDIATSNPIDDFWLAVSNLRNAVTSAAHAWASRAPRILHGLSGGLDSSIVLSCLYTARSLPHVTCFTHFAEGTDGDERVYARAAAGHFDAPHIECRRTPDVDLREALHGLRLESNPGMRVRHIERLEPDAARDLNANIITRGLGGDELFCRHHSYYYTADLLRDRGLSFELMDQLAHSAIFEGETLWTIIARTVRGAWIPYRWNLASVFREEQQGQSLLNPEIQRYAEDSADFDLPYTRTTRRCGPGKLWQISLVTARRPYYSPWWREGDPQVIAPLLSQPVVETCLRIPTYLQTVKRGERAVARAAFAAALPQEIIARRSKGGADEFAWKMFRRNLSFIRELLLDGQVARQGLVSHARLEAALDDAMSSNIRSTVPFFELVGAEAFLQPWLSPHIRNELSRTPDSSASAGHPAS